MALLLQQEGKWKEAIVIARQIIRRRPRVYRAHRLIASCYEELGRSAMAERFYKQSLTIKQSPVTWCLLAFLLSRFETK